jgi:hypothetical protein
MFRLAGALFVLAGGFSVAFLPACFLPFLRSAITMMSSLIFVLLAFAPLVVAQCFYNGDGCTHCSSDGFDVDYRCPDFCGDGRLFTFI